MRAASTTSAEPCPTIYGRSSAKPWSSNPSERRIWREAKRRAHPIAIQTEADFLAARERRSVPPRTELSEAERAHLVAAYLHHRLAEDEAQRVEGTKEDDDLYKSLKAQVEAHGGTANFTEREATAPIGLSERAYQKKSEAL